MSTELRNQLIEAKRKLAEVQAFLDLVEGLSAPVVVVPEAPKAEAGLQNRPAFYAYVRGEAGELFPSMTQAQLGGCERLMDAGAGVLPRSWCAYLLATVYHETGRRMQPVREGFEASDIWRKKHLRYFPWYGRGDIQLTWEYNYKKAGDFIGVDLCANPDLALEPANSARIAVCGMVEGWFTGKKLRDFLPANASFDNFKAARRIINGTDKDDLIAGYAVEFNKALKLGDWR